MAFAPWGGTKDVQDAASMEGTRGRVVIRIDSSDGVRGLSEAAQQRPGTDIWVSHFEEVTSVQIEVLDGDEKERAARFRFEEDRRRWRAARAFLRLVLGAYLDVEPFAVVFHLGPQGKPFVEPGHEFNLSHSGDLVLIAVSDVAVGVDVERVDRVRANESIADRYFDQSERRWIESSPDKDHAFYRLWTIKESVMKADGRGMSIPLEQVNVNVSSLDGSGSVVCRAGDSGWAVTELGPGSGYCGAVATRQPGAVRVLGFLPRAI